MQRANISAHIWRLRVVRARGKRQEGPLTTTRDLLLRDGHRGSRAKAQAKIDQAHRKPPVLVNCQVSLEAFDDAVLVIEPNRTSY